MPSNPSLAGPGSSPRSSLLAAILAGLLVAGLAATLVATPVAAHAYLSESDPENGEQLEAAPEAVTLTFSGDGVVNADVSIEGPDGENAAGEPEIDPDDTQVVRVPIDGADEDGMYAVDWEILADDGHTTSGSFFFAVGDEPLDRDAVLDAQEADETDEPISPIEAGSKGLLLVGIAGLLGIPATAAVAAGPVFARTGASPRNTLQRRVRRLLIGAGALALAGAVVLGLARSTSLGPLSIETVGEFLETPLGRAWIAQLVVATVVAGIAVGATRGLARRPSLTGAFAGGLALAGTVAVTSHSSTAIDRLQGTVVDFAHVVGAGLWFGGLAVLALAVLPAARDVPSADRSRVVAATIRRFSVLALSGVTLVVATGFVLASWHVPTADGLSGTTYGLTLVAKLALVALALGLGGATRFVLLGRLEPSSAGDAGASSRPTSADGGEVGGENLRTVVRAVRLELGVLVAVLLLSGLLTSAPTAAVAGADDGPTEATIEREFDDGIVEIAAVPAAGETEEGEHLLLDADEPIVFEVTFLAGGEPASSDQPVRLLASGEDGTELEVELEEIDDGGYATVQPLPEDGDWELRVTGAPGGAYVSEWVDATVVSAAEEGHDHDDGETHDDHSDDHDDEHAAHDDHDHGDDDSPLTVLLQFGAAAVAVVGTVAVVLEGIRVRDRGP